MEREIDRKKERHKKIQKWRGKEGARKKERQ